MTNRTLLCIAILCGVCVLALLCPSFYKDINPNSVMKFYNGQIVECVLNKMVGQVVALDWRNEFYIVRIHDGKHFKVVRMKEFELKAHGE